jgi:hypothetical protein
MRSLALLVVTLWIGCATSTIEDEVDEPPPPPPRCEELRCRVTDCAKQGRPETTISGAVLAPNGTLPLHGISVYVPNRDPGPLPDGAQCTRCVSQLPGDPIVLAVSDEMGRFTLAGAPDGEDVPVVITVGKWRRQLRIPVAACTDNPLSAAQTSLPRNRAEGDLPRIALVTGNCDALECLVRKLGIDDAEFTPDTGDGRVHLFTSNGAERTVASGLFSPAIALWGSVDKLKQYDLAMFSCECSQQPGNKPQAAMDALKAYADLGGRAFLSHYHSVWISGEYGRPAHAPRVWPTIATCDLDLNAAGTGMIDQAGNARGSAFASWMAAVGGSTTYGRLPIMDARQTCKALDRARAERWVYLQDGASQILQNFQFTTPNERAEPERCGKVVFSDMHVASGSTSNAGVPFPMGCSTGPMTPQEKALAFMFFDIASCVGPIL